MLDIRSELGTKLPPRPKTEIVPQRDQMPPAESSSIRTGAIVVLSTSALKLSRELRAIESNPDLEPEARIVATQELRQLALKIFTGD